MKIKQVEYSALLNLGNYQNEKIGFTAQVEEGETVEQVVEALRQKVKEIGGENAEDLYNKLYDGRNQLRTLERKIAEAAEKWNQTAEFLKAQGLKPDAPTMPMFNNLLPEVKEESSSVVEGEFEQEESSRF